MSFLIVVSGKAGGKVAPTTPSSLEVQIIIHFLKNYILVEKIDEKSFLIKRTSFCVNIQLMLEYLLLRKMLCGV